MSVGDYVKLGTLRSVARFRDRLQELGIDIPVDENILAAPESALARPAYVFGKMAGNRWAIHPMEGWDGTADGRPTEKTLRRWTRFGESGAKLIWGGEAVAVRPDGRANPNQLVIGDHTAADLSHLRDQLVEAHSASIGDASDLVIGLQLTHSGRFCRPSSQSHLEPQILYRHPILDRKFGVAADHPVMTDDEVRRLRDDFVRAARTAQSCGFDFVDVKHCHGYLGHEMLSAVSRPGPYGGSLDNRARFLREVVDGIRAEAPGLGIGVRLSAFDLVPYRPDPDQSLPGRVGPGVFEDYCDCMPYKYAFGCDPDQPTDIDLTETVQLFEILRQMDVRVINVTAGSPYYNPHIQRPALYPPSDGYQPPEDPLIGAARQMCVVRYLKRSFPDFTFVGTAYSYFQEFLPHVAQAAVHDDWTDFVGLGRMVLSYPELPAHTLRGLFEPKKLCRTFSDCTTAPRNGMVSGCYPLDPYYKRSLEGEQLAQLKRRTKG